MIKPEIPRERFIEIFFRKINGVNPLDLSPSCALSLFSTMHVFGRVDVTHCISSVYEYWPSISHKLLVWYPAPTRSVCMHRILYLICIYDTRCHALFIKLEKWRNAEAVPATEPATEPATILIHIPYYSSLLCGIDNRPLVQRG